MSRIVAVTGATGFCGTALVRALAARGDRVVATDLYPPAGELPAARFVRADVRDRAAMEGVVADAEVVYHLAAIPSIARRSEADYRSINAEATGALLALAAQAGVARFVHFSSSTVYGVPKTCPLPEGAPLRPSDAYSRSKVESERLCEAAAARGLAVTVLRPRVVVGPGRAGVFALLFGFVDAGLPVPLVGGGRNRFQLAALDDLVGACVAAGDVRGAGGGLSVYNVGSEARDPIAADLRALIAHAGSRSRLVSVPAGPLMAGLALAHRLGVSPLVPEQYRIADADFVLDTSRARDELGFVPRAANVDGLLAAWDDWVARHGGRGLRHVAAAWRTRRQNTTQRLDVPEA